MARPTDSPLAGTYWKIVSLVAFAIVNALVKQLSGGGSPTSTVFSVPMLVFFENLFGTLLFLPVFLKSKSPFFPQKYLGLHFFRIIFALAGILLWFSSLKYLSMAQAVALQFTGPIFTVLGAWFFLKESLNPLRLMAISISFVGAFVIMDPLQSLSDAPWQWATCLPLLAALAFAVDKLINRKLCILGETTYLLSFYLMFFMTPLSFVMAVSTWQMPTLDTLPSLLALGAAVALANYSMIKAFALAEVTLLTPIGFLKFFVNVVVGYFFFGEISSSPSLWGGSLLILTSVFVLTEIKHRATPIFKSRPVTCTKTGEGVSIQP